MNTAPRWIVLILLGLISPILVASWVGSASTRLENFSAQEQEEEVAVASASNAEYCSVGLKKVLRRVLQSCGLIGRDGARGCQPLEAKTLATVSGPDFNALFKPMKERGGIIQFEAESSELDPEDRKLVNNVYADQKGASYFFVVARASPDGAVSYNRELSKARAQSVMNHLSSTFQDPDLERHVGLLWLGEEFAQLEEEFCDWRRSGDEECNSSAINRGAFMAWIDCQL